jgi:hypothetical protein
VIAAASQGKATRVFDAVAAEQLDAGAVLVRADPPTFHVLLVDRSGRWKGLRASVGIIGAYCGTIAAIVRPRAPQLYSKPVSLTTA